MPVQRWSRVESAIPVQRFLLDASAVPSTRLRRCTGTALSTCGSLREHVYKSPRPCVHIAEAHGRGSACTQPTPRLSRRSRVIPVGSDGSDAVQASPASFGQVVYPRDAYTAKGLLLACIRDREFGMILGRIKMNCSRASVIVSSA